jgi:hypothetical protein
MEELMATFNIVKIIADDQVQSDGGRIERCVGCDGHAHFVNTNKVWYGGGKVIFARDLHTMYMGMCNCAEPGKDLGLGWFSWENPCTREPVMSFDDEYFVEPSDVLDGAEFEDMEEDEPDDREDE